MKKRVFAVGCHPDDIEFMMSGTLMRLKDAGFELHYMNVANGSCGSDKLGPEEIIQIRRQEALAAAEFIGAEFHESIANDIEVFYNRELLAELGSVIRKVKPDIILTHSLEEYMEDHANTCRLVVTAAFCRGMKNFPVNPPLPPVTGQVEIYHALPYGLRTPLNEKVTADFYVDVESKMSAKTEMLACHASQKNWLDASQGIDSYLKNMQDLCSEMGKMSDNYKYAEGWCQHLHIGFGDTGSSLLTEVLNAK